MGNCLKTQLKESVNNDNLPILDVLTIFVNHAHADSLPQENRVFQVRPYSDNTLTMTNVGGMFCDANGENQYQSITFNVHTLQTIYYTAATNKILLTKQYTEILNIAPDAVSLRNLYVNYDDLKYALNCKDIKLGGEMQTGKLSDSSLCPNLNLLSVNATSINGNLSDLGNITLPNTLFLNSDGITGDVESLIYKSDGTLRPAKTFHLLVGYQKVKYKGEYIGVSQHTVVLDGQGGITVDGV